MDVGGCLRDPGLTLSPTPGGSFRSVPSLGDLMLTYGVSYYPDSDDSHAPGSSLDLSPELPAGALGCFLTALSHWDISRAPPTPRDLPPTPHPPASPPPGSPS